MDAGELAAERLESLRKLAREQEFLERKQDARLQSAEKNRWKKVHKEQKRNYQWREKQGRY